MAGMHAFDLLLLAFKGIAIASLPLAIVWMSRAVKHPAGRLGRLAWLTTFLTFDLVLFGGFTRLTDSGLGCPDWPGCYAKANPLMAADDIRAAERALPSGPVTMDKAWIEMIHRYLAIAVGVLILTMLVMSIVQWRRAARVHRPSAALPGTTVTLLGLVMLQGAFGAWTVTQRLQPIFVTTHLLLGLSLLALLVWHALRLDDRAAGSSSPARAPARGLRTLAGIAFIVLAVQVVLGGWVSANYAVLACTDFPTCQGVWLPVMDFANGFTPWRALGRTADGGYLSVAALTAIHWTHRSCAAVVFVVVGTLAWRLRRDPRLAKAALALGIVLVAQIVTGLVNVVFAWPLVAAVLHNAGAASLVGLLVVINYRLSPQSAPQSAQTGNSPVTASAPRSPRAHPVTGFNALR